MTLAYRIPNTRDLLIPRGAYDPEPSQKMGDTLELLREDQPGWSFWDRFAEGQVPERLFPFVRDLYAAAHLTPPV